MHRHCMFHSPVRCGAQLWIMQEDGCLQRFRLVWFSSRNGRGGIQHWTRCDPRVVAWDRARPQGDLPHCSRAISSAQTKPPAPPSQRSYPR